MSLKSKKATQVLVLEHLRTLYPQVGRKFLLELLRESDSNHDDSFWHEEQWREKTLREAAMTNLEAFLAAGHKPSSSKRPRHDSSDSDDAEPKKATPKRTPKRTPAKPVVDSSDSDSDAAPKAPPKRTPKSAAKPVVDSSDSDCDAAPPKKSTKPVDSDSDVELKVTKLSAAQPPRASAGGMNGGAVPAFKPRTSRIDVDAVRFHHDRLKDNTAGEEATNFLQNQKMLAVRGKEFNKHKQKNKSKLYAAGVETSVRSFKFDED